MRRYLSIFYKFIIIFLAVYTSILTYFYRQITNEYRILSDQVTHDSMQARELLEASRLWVRTECSESEVQ